MTATNTTDESERARSAFTPLYQGAVFAFLCLLAAAISYADPQLGTGRVMFFGMLSLCSLALGCLYAAEHVLSPTESDD